MEMTSLVAQATKPALTVPCAARDLFVDLDCRGLVLSSNQDGHLRVSRKDGAGPPELSDTDRADIKTWKLHLLALVAYCREEP